MSARLKKIQPPPQHNQPQQTFRNRKPKQSLRTILMVWSVFFSVVPLMFVTGYTLVTYEQALDIELVERLRANVREFVTTIGDYEKYLDSRTTRYQADPSLSYHLSTNSGAQARAQVQQYLRNSLISVASIFNRDGERLGVLTPDDQPDPKDGTGEDPNISLHENLKSRLDKDRQVHVVDVGPKNSMGLIMLSRLESKGRLAGYIEEIISIGPAFLEGLKKRLNLEIILFDSRGNIIAGSHPDFQLYQKNYFARSIVGEKETVFAVNIREEPFRFIVSQVNWGESSFLIGLGASKQKAQAALRNVSYAFFTVVGAIVVLLILTIVIGTRRVLRPLNDLVEAIQTMDQREGPVQIPVSSNTELGVLTESFNEMSQRVSQARNDLQKKITELESAYSELKETQARLVHSAKMASLGQLVAGVAHELNNPIGFIFSNMSHLRDYSNRLLQIIETAEKNPDAIKAKKKEVDFDYIIQDLPRLITSCEDGARRTRDIVLGLRNFSRLEEAKIKKVDLHDGIEETLRLLAGELKGRIKVNKDFGHLPQVMCYASQLNQVFMNILSNAAQAIEGEGQIWIKTRLQRAGKGQRVQVSIKDSGRGMNGDVTEKIFDPFFTTKSVGQGTGLGLSISYGIVKKHGGDIEVKSEPGKGTEFVISVPVEGPPESQNS